MLYLPPDTITETFTFFEAGTYTLINPPFTLIGYQINVDGGTLATEKLKKGDKVLGYSWESSKAVNISPYIPINEISTSTPLSMEHRANNKTLTILINYLPYNIKSNPPIYPIVYASQNATTISATTSGFTIDKSYSYGDITEILLLGSILFAMIFYILKKLFLHDSVKSIHKNFF